jgi:hypothetical protein
MPDYFDSIDAAMRQFRIWQKWEKLQDDPEPEYQVALKMPEGLRAMLAEEAALRGMATGSLIKFVLYEWVKEQQRKRKADKKLDENQATEAGRSNETQNSLRAKKRA